MLARHLNRAARPVRYSNLGGLDSPAMQAMLGMHLYGQGAARLRPGAEASLDQLAGRHAPLLRSLLGGVFDEHDPVAAHQYLDAHQDALGDALDTPPHHRGHDALYNVHNELEQIVQRMTGPYRQPLEQAYSPAGLLHNKVQIAGRLAAHRGGQNHSPLAEVVHALSLLPGAAGLVHPVASAVSGNRAFDWRQMAALHRLLVPHQQMEASPGGMLQGHDVRSGVRGIERVLAAMSGATLEDD